MLDNPVYAGIAILENSKIPMYDFYYNTLKKQYGSKCELVYKATDSLCWRFKLTIYTRTWKTTNSKLPPTNSNYHQLLVTTDNN